MTSTFAKFDGGEQPISFEKMTEFFVGKLKDKIMPVHAVALTTNGGAAAVFDAVVEEMSPDFSVVKYYQREMFLFLRARLIQQGQNPDVPRDYHLGKRIADRLTGQTPIGRAHAELMAEALYLIAQLSMAKGMIITKALSQAKITVPPEDADTCPEWNDSNLDDDIARRVR